ncbi:MAG: hypothetical protein ACOCRK_02640 [bacterium]
MADNFYSGVRYGDEVVVSIGKSDGTSWTYTEVAHREGFSPDIPEDTEAVFDRLTYKGDKKIQVEKTLSITQMMPSDYDSGLYAFEDLNGLVIKEEIVTYDDSNPTTPERYFTNVNLRKVTEDEVPNSGAFNISIPGRYDDIAKTEPDPDESWVTVYE